MVDEGIALPRFMAEVKNQTVTAGRAARLTCKVKDLGNYKVRNIIHNQKFNTALSFLSFVLHNSELSLR
jgi:hypothetical protein